MFRRDSPRDSPRLFAQQSQPQSGERMSLICSLISFTFCLLAVYLQSLSVCCVRCSFSAFRERFLFCVSTLDLYAACTCIETSIIELNSLAVLLVSSMSAFASAARTVCPSMFCELCGLPLSCFASVVITASVVYLFSRFIQSTVVVFKRLHSRCDLLLFHLLFA